MDNLLDTSINLAKKIKNMHALIKFRVIICIIILCLYSTVVPSIFQKGGIPDSIRILNFTIQLLLCFYLIAFNKHILFLEKIIIPIIVTVASLIIFAFIPLDKIHILFFGIDYEFKLWKFMPAFFSNIIIKLSFFLIVLFLCEAYCLIRKIMEN